MFVRDLMLDLSARPLTSDLNVDIKGLFFVCVSAFLQNILQSCEIPRNQFRHSALICHLLIFILHLYQDDHLDYQTNHHLEL